MEGNVCGHLRVESAEGGGADAGDAVLDLKADGAGSWDADLDAKADAAGATFVKARSASPQIWLSQLEREKKETVASDSETLHSTS